MRLGIEGRLVGCTARLAAVAVVGALMVAAPVGTAPPAAGQVTQPPAPTSVDIGADGTFEDLAVDPATGNVVVSGGDEVVLVDDDLVVLDRLALPGAAGLAIAGDDLWVAQTDASAIARVDLATLDVEQSYPAGTTVDGSVVVVGGFVWFTGALSGDRNFL
ncbi:hypothetical protein B7486_72460, partial [cyanobacterium TDX16]